MHWPPAAGLAARRWWRRALRARCVKDSWSDYGNPCFDEAAHQPHRHRPVERESNRSLGGRVSFQRGRVRATDVRRDRKQAAVIAECRVPNQRTSVQAEARHPIAETFDGAGSRDANGSPKRPQCLPRGGRRARDVVTNGRCADCRDHLTRPRESDGNGPRLDTRRSLADCGREIALHRTAAREEAAAGTRPERTPSTSRAQAECRQVR